jgi:ubiquinone/menaquinone biosynthesis C-methylase UbiE
MNFDKYGPLLFSPLTFTALVYLDTLKILSIQLTTISSPKLTSIISPQGRIAQLDNKTTSMLQTNPFEKFVAEYEDWYDKYPEVYQSELAAIKQQLHKLPNDIQGIEVGLGTGRFAAPLGIKEGIEPEPEMARLAIKRGVEIMHGRAERLPYRDLHFDFVLFVTISHFNNVRAALKEAYRVLKSGGSIVMAFLDKDRDIAKSYEAKRIESRFYKSATFYTVEQVIRYLELAGFRNPEFVQTLFGELDEIDEMQSPKEGYGEGSFVVVKASKK